MWGVSMGTNPNEAKVARKLASIRSRGIIHRRRDIAQPAGHAGSIDMAGEPSSAWLLTSGTRILPRDPLAGQGIAGTHSGRLLMDRDGFWALIDASLAASGGDQDGQRIFLRDALAARSTEEIFAYDRECNARMAECYRADLWGAAYLIKGGCSDDDFEYFRRWLISRGRRAFEAALADPDSLADEVSDEGNEENEGSASSLAWPTRRGPAGTTSTIWSDRRATSPASDLIGDLGDWSDDDGDGDPERLKALFPRLYRKFPGD